MKKKKKQKNIRKNFEQNKHTAACNVLSSQFRFAPFGRAHIARIYLTLARNSGSVLASLAYYHLVQFTSINIYNSFFSCSFPLSLPLFLPLTFAVVVLFTRKVLF